MPQTSVLVVDDEPSLLEGLEEFLEDEGYDVYLSTNGNEALDVFQKVDPELIVTDLRMPGISGIEFIRKIKNLKPDALIVVLTGYGSLEAAVEGIRLAVFDFISKPVDLDQLKDSLERARKSIQATRQGQRETDCLREQLVLARSHLELCQQDKKKLDAFAKVWRLMPGILHDLNNPLSYIMGQAQVQQMIHPEMKVFEKIDQQAARMAQIIRSFLKKFKQSEASLEKRLDLNQMLMEEVGLLESHPYFQGDLQKEWRLAADLPSFRGAAADFEQVFGNLLFNAAEAMAGQAIKKLILETFYDDSKITVAIEDNGCGIPTELQGRIFDPFFSTKTAKLGISGGVGTGLGLYSCRQILVEYGGGIEVTNISGQGARFEICLPRIHEQ